MGVAVETEKTTWFKIASFYNLVSATAVDCVRLDHPKYIYGLVEAAWLVIERDLANWIDNQGGLVVKSVCITLVQIVLVLFQFALIDCLLCIFAIGNQDDYATKSMLQMLTQTAWSCSAN